MPRFEEIVSKLKTEELREYRDALAEGKSIDKYRHIDDQLSLLSSQGKILLINDYLEEHRSGKTN